MSGAGDIRIGISGWTYAPWRGGFYPRGLPQRQELAHASTIFRTIEINGTFYGLQKPASFAAWIEATPEDFVFSVKAPRFITHMLRLRDAATPLANFLASGVLRLGAKLGPILWQLPPNFRFDIDLVAPFLAMLPHDTEAAAALARQHDTRKEERGWTTTDARRPLRHALEIRNDTFKFPAFVDLLRTNNVALVCADAVAWPRLGDLTSDFVYCRLHGSEELYASGYTASALDAWASRVVTWARGGEAVDLEHIGTEAHEQRRDVFVYFDNDRKVCAPRDAEALTARTGTLLRRPRSRRQA
jgi:uncharacterized protein YecE (DUF72 family)